MKLPAALAALTIVLAGCGSAAAPASSSGPAASVGSTPPAGSAAPSAQTALNIPPLRYGINGGVPSSAFVWLMGDAGVFKQNGLPVELRGMNGQAQTNAMVAGDLDAEMHAGIALVLSAAAQGSNFKIVAVMQPVYDLEMVVPDSIKSPQDLKGKKVGSQTTTSANSMATRHYLGQYGLQQDRDYTLVQTGSQGSEQGMVAQLLSHQVEAVAVTPTAADPAMAQGGFHVLVDFAKTDVRVASQAVVVQATYVQAHPDAVQRLVDSMIQGVRYYKEHKAEAEATMRKQYKLTDQKVLDALYDRQAQLLVSEPTVSKADFEDVVASMPKDGPQLSEDRLSAMLDNHYVEDAAKRGLTKF
ncbi:MAG TPA: ABC transporter substrate-binding protein [Chloroflexota bacterium]|nr:ABC transporter substrate-binding protein [Chloroflexota bacterium]